jgi:hypothetical protein
MIYDLLLHVFSSNIFTLKETNSFWTIVLWRDSDLFGIKKYAN